MNEVENQPPWRLFRFTRFSLSVSMVVILVSVFAGWLAYLTGRGAIQNFVARENLSIAQLIVNEVEFNFKKQGSLESRQLAMDLVSGLWERTETPISGSYLCVIERPGRLALDTENPSQVGTNISEVMVEQHRSDSRTMLDLLNSKGSLATESVDFQGQTQLVGYAYSPALDSLVAVQVPAKMVESQIRKAALPWALASTLLAVLLVSFAIGLSNFDQITDRKQTQQHLQMTQFSVDTCNSPIFWIRRDASFSYVNEAASGHFGFTREELLRMSVHDIDPAYPKELWPKYWDEMQREQSLTFESEIRRKDGVLVPVELTTNLLVIEGQEFVFAFVKDITERKAAEALVSSSEARFRALVENSYDVIGMFRQNGRLAYASPSIERVLGYAPAALVDVKLGSLLHPEELEGATRVIRRLLRKSDSIVHAIHRLRHQNGSYRTVEVTATNLLHQPGVNAIVAVFRDITERTLAEVRLHKRESQLTRVARISTMGEIAAGIAHEIKQPLHAVVNFSTASEVELRSLVSKQILKSEFAKDLREWNQGIQSATQRASEIVQRLRRFVRASDGKHESASVVSLVREAIDLMAFESRRHHVTIEVNIEQDIPDVFCDRIQVQQVLVNLLQNANEALRQTENRDRHVRIVGVKSEEWIEIEVSDNGPGVGSENCGKIFDAFYSSKPNGLGMGLAISRTIVENHGGRLRVEKNESGGATFGFKLPVAKDFITSIRENVDAIEANRLYR